MGEFTDLLTDPAPEVPQEEPVFTDMLLGTERQPTQPVAPAGLAPNSAAAPEPGFFESVKRSFTGEGQFNEDLPEIGASVTDRLMVLNRQRAKSRPFGGLLQSGPGASDEEFDELSRLRNAVTIPRSTAGKLGGILQVRPDTKVTIDDHGNPILEMDGKRFFINRPGLTGADMQDVTTDLLFEAPLIFAFSRGGGALAGKTGRAVGAGGGAASGSLLRDLTANLTGFEEEFDIHRAGLSAALAGTFELLAPVFTSFFSRVFGRRELFNASTGELTQRGREVLTRAGIDPDSVTPEFARQFQTATKQGATSAEATRLAEAQSLPEPVQLSQGDVTGRGIIQATESAAERGAFGKASQAEAAGFREGQREALSANAQRFQEGLGGRVEEAGEGVAAVQNRLRAERDTLKNSVDDAFTAAGGKGASVVRDGVEIMGRTVKKAFGARFNKFTAPKASGMVERLATMRKSFSGKVTRVNVGALENWRQQVSTLTRSSDPLEVAAAHNILQSFDDTLAKVVDEGLLAGDQTALAAFKNARGLRAQLVRKFGSDDIVKSLTETATINGQTVLKLTPTKALNKIFTVSNLGAKAESVRALQRVKSLLGEASPEFQALKEEAVLRLLTNQAKEPADFSAAKFVTAFDKANVKSKELLKALFSPRELAELAQLRNVARTISKRAPGAVNNFNFAIVDRILGNFGFLGNIARDVLKGSFTGFWQARTERLIRDSFLKPLGQARTRLQGVGGTVGAGAETAREQISGP